MLKQGEIDLQQVRWNCSVHEEGGPSVILQSAIFCSPPLQSLSLPILMGLSVTVGDLQRQQQAKHTQIMHVRIRLIIFPAHDKRDTFSHI